MALSPLDSRRVPLERSFNFRDLGGYAAADGRMVRTGQLFRADGLQMPAHFMECVTYCS